MPEKLKFWVYLHPKEFLAREYLLETGGKTFMRSKYMTFRDVKESRFLDIPSKLSFDIWKVIYTWNMVKNGKKEINMSKKAQNLGMQSSK